MRIESVATTAKESGSKNTLYAGLILLALCMLVTILVTSYYIYLYSQEPVVVTGKLEDVQWARNNSIAIYVDGNRYVVHKDPYSSRSFGVLGNTKLGTLMTTWEKKIGSECKLEYVKTGSRYNKVVDLTIDGFDFIHKDIAINDNIDDQKTMRYIGIVVLFLAVVCVSLVYKGFIIIK